MAMNSESGNTVMKLWLLMHRVHDALALCEDSIFKECGLTSEQFRLLGAVKGSGGYLRPIDLASILERSPNSVSMLVDRMVKAGLVKRTRDRKDRRTVNVALTSKGEKALGSAMPAGWEFIQEILSRLAYEDKHALADLLETMKCEFLAYLKPEVDRAVISKNSVTNRPDLYKEYQRVMRDVPPSGSDAESQVAKRKKAR
jgi:DNA-binding MarR family transcriptional regulator